MKKFFLFMLTCLLCLAAACASADVVINEIMTNNGVFVDDEHHDWIELHNNGSADVDLSGYGLSDSKKKPMKWVFPEGATLPAGGYVLVYCTDEGEFASNLRKGIYYAPFKLSDEGENLVLSNAKEQQLDLVEYPQQYGNISWGRAADGNEWGFFDHGTPRAANEKTAYAERAERPVIETAAGFYTLNKGENLSVTISGEGEIRYTLDGSEPTRQSQLYADPITISKTTVVRARVCDADKLMSVAVGATYLINDPSPVAVVSLSTDDKYFNDKEIGVFVRGNGDTPNYMKELEHPIHIEYFDESGVRQLAQNASFHITGTSSRGYAQKSMGIYARDAYGDANRFYFNPFENRDYDAYKSIQLRSTGSDGRASRMRDVVLTSLAKGLGLMYQDSRPVVVYINGEYWGHYNLREKVNKHSIAQWEGVTDKALIDQIDVLEGMAREDQIQNGSSEDWLALRAYVKEHDLNDPTHLQYVTDRLDVDNFFTWVSLQLVFRNADLENVRMYRVPDGKWKYVLYDLDGGGVSDPQGIYMLMYSSKAGGQVSSQYSLLSNLLKVPEMKDRFLTTFAHVIEHSFLYESVVDPIIDRWEAILKELLPRHLKRYTSLTLPTWRTNVGAFRYAIRTSPRKTIDEVSTILGLTKAEKERYFSHVLELLTVQNAKDKQ